MRLVRHEAIVAPLIMQRVLDGEELGPFRESLRRAVGRMLELAP